MHSTSSPVESATRAAIFPPLALSPLSQRGRWLLVVCLGALLFFKVEYALHMTIDSDEPQHLHTVWAWTQGQLPYRDVFDNHMPLFQWLCAPLFHALGERANIVPLMRLAMIPLFFAMLWCVYGIAAALHSPRAGWCALLVTGFCRGFFFVSTELRTDDLWTLAWLGALLVLARSAPKRRSGIAFGLLVGMAFSVSMKTSLLFGTLTLAGAVVLLLRARQGRGTNWSGLAQWSAVAIGCATILPAAIGAYFALHGAWKPFCYCVFQHNVVPGVIETGGVPHAWRPFFFPVAVPLFVAFAWQVLRLKGLPSPSRTALLVLASGFYLTALWSYWPILSAEDYEPFFPMLIAGLVPVLFSMRPEGWARQPFRWEMASGVTFAMLTGAWVVPTRHFWHDDTAPDIRMVQDVLNLTAPGQFVMDGKCESIYRPRPYYYVIETMTDARLKRGLLEDDISKRLIDTATPVARLERLPSAAHRFVHANYVRITPRLLVLGKTFTSSVPTSGHHSKSAAIKFELSIPGRYSLYSIDGMAEATLDGNVLQGPVYLEAGAHELKSSTAPEQLVLVWADAIERGYQPLQEFDVKREPLHSHAPRNSGRKWRHHHRHHFSNPSDPRNLSTT